MIVHAAPEASAFWFMIGTGDADRASSYFQSKEQDIDLDDGAPFTDLQQLADAPFTIHVCQQRRGDLILLPPRCAHQRINHGGMVGSLAWSRMTVPSLCHAIYQELPIYNRIARPETYRVKLTLYYAVRHVASLPPDPQMAAVLDELLELLDMTLISEYAPGVLTLQPAGAGASYDKADPDFLSCDVCSADIFVTHFACKKCEKDVCAACYTAGRACACVRGLRPAVVVRFQDVLDVRNKCARALEGAKGERVAEMNEV